MIALVLGAVRARTAQALTVLILTTLIAAVAAAGPWYAIAASSRAADGDVAAAPAGQRTLSVRKSAATEGDPQTALDAFRSTVGGLLPIPNLEPVLGMTVALTTGRGEGSPSMSVSYRDDLCTHVRLTGPCPAARGEAAISQDAAEQLGVAPGGDLELRASQNTVPVKLRVVATYVVVDQAGAYWSNNLFRANGGIEPAFTPVETFADDQLFNPTLTYDVGVPQELIRGDDGYDLAGVLRVADPKFDAAGLRLVNPTWQLLGVIAGDKRTIREAVIVALCQVLVLGLFAIGLAGRYTGRQRRGDAALLKLRGSTRGGMLTLALGQHLVPMLAGALLGAPLGFLAARLLAGPVLGAADATRALWLSAAAVGLVVLGGLLVLFAVEAAVLRLPVVRLLSGVGNGRRDWRADVIDLVLLALAVGAAYQVRAGRSAGGLVLVAPALVALAVALLLARLLGRVADRGGGAALRAGRLRLGLVAAQTARRPGAHRVFALVAVAVAIFTGTAGAWSAGREARTQRSEVELGAPRVLTVQAANRTALLRAVHNADPDGTRAMAVVVNRDSLPQVVAVDSARLAAIAAWRPEYGALDTLAAAVRANPAPAATLITGNRLTLRLRNDDTSPVVLTAVLQHEASGVSRTVDFGPVAPGEHLVRATVEGCTAAPGCRLLRWQLGSPPENTPRPGSPSARAAVTVLGLTQQDPSADVLDAAALGDPRRWRPDFTAAAVDVTATAGALTMRMDRDGAAGAQSGNRVFAVDATLPLPVVMAGAQPAAWQFSDPVVYALGGSGVRVRVAGTAPVLPVVGGAGILVDLDTARRISADGDLGGTFQVWLARDAGDDVLAALRTNGLTVIDDASTAERAGRLEAQGTAVGATFGLLAAGVGLLLAAAAVAVAAAVERGPQLEQLAALRIQGLPRRVAVTIGYAGNAALVAAGLLAGLLAAAVARPVVGVTVRPFTDEWTLIPPPGALGITALAGAAAVALLTLGVTSWLSVRPMVRKLYGSGR
jgi:putative ABC transport system permease protein